MTSGKRPNIVIFNPDQWRGDVMGHMGNPAAVTPNVDRSVQTDAVSFRYAYCQNTVCTPSRCSFMSGWYPHTRGHRTMHYMMQPDEPVLLKALKDNGYRVWWGGKNDLIPGQNGWEDYADIKDNPPGKPHDGAPTMAEDFRRMRGEPGDDTYYGFYRGKIDLTDEDAFRSWGDWGHVMDAVEFIRNGPKDKPFCVYLPVGFPHPPYCVEEPFFSLVDRQKVPPRAPTPEDWTGLPSLMKGIFEGQGLDGWTEDRWRELRATYYGMCARVDCQWGLLVEALKEAGIYDDTAMFLFSDHGDFTGDYGLVEKTQNTFQECLARVPFVIKPPADTPVKPRVSEAMTELIDFTATALDFAGIDPDWWHFGRSLREVLSGETDEHRDAVFCEGGRLAGESQAMELPSASHLPDPSVTEYWPRIKLQRGDGPEHGKGVMCRDKRYKYVRRLYEADELYDLQEDPYELSNRIDDPALADVLARLKERTLTFFMETGDVVPLEPDKRGFGG